MFGLIFIYWQWYSFIQEHFLFKKGRNKFTSICRKCGSHQDQYRSTAYSGVWWEEMYPIGNNPDCRCHKHAQHRNY